MLALADLEMFAYRSVVVNSTTVFILRDLPAIASAVPAPPVVWRAETGFQHDPDSSAADVARYEQEALGNSLGFPPGFLLDLEAYPACALLWVTFTHADALRYGDAEDVQELRLDIPAYVIATDNEGGFLLFFPDDLTQPTGGAAMADRFDKDPAAELRAEIKAEIYADAGFSPAAAAAASRNAADAVQQGISVEPSRAADFDAEEEKRRAGRGGGGDMPNPAHANLGANIRPDVVSAPGGLQTITTAKSADHDQQNASDYIRGLLARAEQRANPAKQQELEAERAPLTPDDLPEALTLEAIAADPWNAVELPLPADADKELLIAARSAAEYCADGHHELMMKAIAGEYTPPNWTGVGDGTEPDVHEYDEGKWLQADARLNLIDERLEQFEERAPDAATQQANDESAKRQDAERAARSGESVSPENSASGSDYVRDLISRAQEAKAERESEGAENVVLEHGEGQTPGGGGGRGIF